MGERELRVDRDRFVIIYTGVDGDSREYSVTFDMDGNATISGDLEPEINAESEALDDFLNSFTRAKEGGEH